ncbi:MULTISPECIES: hypothetical protein [Pseudomonas]|jgi:hypothetical protein|uniref:hypothetical protein n=1 Tax=Pseudomonas TaxID=286 RepID=UPI0015E36253|nr:MULTISPECIES: hypothetical protein [Pseudomonas]MBA1300093.1 hypothetical protein [Pseudomonas carnis]MBJ2203086.1 hypothetical protein [Pseudomonas carnis]MBW9245433.1 hypothetical protein [Pseudomonas paracarnis]ULN82664.1 hypothetical protein HXW87_10920 [Pseudomonas sp. Y5-11]
MNQRELLEKIYSDIIKIKGVIETDYGRDLELKYLEEIKQDGFQITKKEINKEYRTTIDNRVKAVEYDDLIAIVYTSEFLGAIVVMSDEREEMALFGILETEAYSKILQLLDGYKKSP